MCEKIQSNKFSARCEGRSANKIQCPRKNNSKATRSGWIFQLGRMQEEGDSKDKIFVTPKD